MKRLIILVSLLAGCSSNVTTFDIERAKRICESEGYQFEYIIVGYVQHGVKCSNGLKFEFPASISTKDPSPGTSSI